MVAERTMEKTETPFATVKTIVTDKQVKGLLVGAFEGGSNYWCRVEGERYAEGFRPEQFRDRRRAGGELGDRCDPDDYYHPWQLIPLAEGCELLLAVDDEEPGVNEWAPEPNGRPAGDDRSYRTLNRAKLIRGIEVLAEVFPKVFADWVKENDDADTADLYLQCCLFADEVLKTRNSIFC